MFKKMGCSLRKVESHWPTLLIELQELASANEFRAELQILSAATTTSISSSQPTLQSCVNPLPLPLPPKMYINKNTDVRRCGLGSDITRARGLV